MEEVIDYMKDYPAPFSTKIKIKKKLWEITRFVTISWVLKGLLKGWIMAIYRLYGRGTRRVTYIRLPVFICLGT